MGRNDSGSARKPRSEAVYGALRRAIVERALRPGDRLPEDPIGERFGVSRTSVRSALARLHGEGLVEMRRNRSAAVASPDPEEAREIFEMRRCLEQEVVRRLAGRLGERALAALERHVRLEEQVGEPDGAEATRLADRFHVLLAEATGNRLLARYVQELVSRCALILALYGRPHSSECAVNEHGAVVAALRGGDATAAVAAMGHHLGEVQARCFAEEAGEPGRDLQAVLERYAVAAE